MGVAQKLLAVVDKPLISEVALDNTNWRRVRVNDDFVARVENARIR